MERAFLSGLATLDFLEVAPWPDYTSRYEEPPPMAMPLTWSSYSSEGAGATR